MDHNENECNLPLTFFAFTALVAMAIVSFALWQAFDLAPTVYYKCFSGRIARGGIDMEFRVAVIRQAMIGASVLGVVLIRFYFVLARRFSFKAYVAFLACSGVTFFAAVAAANLSLKLACKIGDAFPCVCVWPGISLAQAADFLQFFIGMPLIYWVLSRLWERFCRWCWR